MGTDAIHPGYGLLSESPEFVDACEDAGIIFIGPRTQTMRDLGNKVAARNMAIASDVPVVPAAEPLLDDSAAITATAVERAPAPYLSDAVRQELIGAAVRLGKAANYRGAGAVEFLMDADTDKFYFIEVNPRIQVEHTVTEKATGIDIVKAQIHLLDGAVIGTSESGVPLQADIHLNGNAIQCRVTIEDPEQNFIPRLWPDHRLSRRDRLWRATRWRRGLCWGSDHAVL